MTDEAYIHGFTGEEQRRLTKMQEILNRTELDAIDLRGVRTLLDVGSGLGQLTRDFARALGGDARVLGIERSSVQLDEARRQAEAAGEADLVELRQGDATALPLEESERGTFDLAHTRFVLEHVPDPAAVVREMVAAVRPDGGRIVLLDDDHEVLRLSPECPEIEHAWRRYWESYRDLGTDPLVGRRLAELLVEAGATPVRVTSVFYGAVRGMELFEPVVANLHGVLAGAAESLDRSGRLSRNELATALEAFDAWSRHPAATVWYSLPLAEGRRTAATDDAGRP